MKTDTARFPVVGVGASAGGLQALESFLRAMPSDPGMAFVIVTHLAPDRKSLLTEILARYTDMTVEVARDGQAVEQNSIYVLPPHAVLTIADGRLRLRETGSVHHERAPIDVFFSPLAQDRGEYAVGIVLSGSGSDGVLGVKAIKQHGGVTMAQTTDLSGPGFAGMPDSAIASGLVDFAIPVETMAAKLVENVRNFAALDDIDEKIRSNDDDRAIVDARHAIYSILRNQTGHDFSAYKTQTFMRRVHRRMQIQQCEAIEDYVERLRQDTGEVTFLFRDLLINVSSFFRDPRAFEALQETIIPRLFEGKGASDWVRVWAPGCATGEEVISIAILLCEHMDRLHAPPRVTIFATDIDDQALNVARAGRYPEALMEGLSSERRQRFFTADSGSYVVAKAVRDLCVFSPHSILRDPPFSRIDLISCRNLLIYFGVEAQRRAFPIFHYALQPSGFLFLGMAESIGQFSDLFAPLDKKHCLFQVRDTGLPVRIPLFSSGLHAVPFTIHLPDRPSVRAGSELRQVVEARVADRFAPPHVVVNEDGDIVYFSSRTGKFLEAPAGAPNRQLLTMARKGLRLDLRSALREAIETQRAATRESGTVEREDDRVERVSLTIEPLPDRPRGQRLFLVLFNERAIAVDAGPSAADGSDDSDGATQLGRELRDTRERLQTTIEEYETALEELKSANEELVSLNEEMQSSNEELESSKEELQSLNEELQTLNSELYGKVQDLDRANSDLNNEFASTGIATVFLDRNLVIRAFSPAAAELFNIIPTDKGRPLTDLVTKLDYVNLAADLRAVLKTGQSIEGRTHKNELDAPYYLARLTAYRNSAGDIDGVVATFVDVTILARSEEHVQKLHADRLNTMREMATGLVHEINQPLSASANYLKAAGRLSKMSEDKRPASVEDTLDKAAEQIVWAGRIVDHLREFVSRGEPDKTFQSLHVLIEESRDLMSQSAQHEDVRVGFKLNATNDRVLVDKVQVKQIIINLMRNAIEAMAGSQERNLTIATSSIEKDMIQVDVADTGAGISEGVKAKLFDPFVTTKTKGVGVGLAISRSIIEAHEGRIWAASNPDGGATVSFTLPVADGETLIV